MKAAHWHSVCCRKCLCASFLCWDIVGDCQADILFLVDSSGSIQDTGTNNYRMLQDFIAALIQRLTIGTDKVRVALAIFSTNAQLIWAYDRYYTTDQLTSAVYGIPYIGGKVPAYLLLVATVHCI